MPKVRPIGFDGIAGIRNGLSMAGIAQVGQTGWSCGFGAIRFGYGKYGDDNLAQGIYQRRHTGYNNHGYIAGLPKNVYYVRMKSYRPTNPNTESQQIARQVFREVIAEWQALTNEQKRVYSERGAKRNLSGYNVFISEHLKNRYHNINF